MAASGFGELVKALYQRISHLLERGGAEDELAMNLLEILAEVCDAITRSGDTGLIDRTLLQRLVNDWNAAAHHEEHHVVVAGLRQSLRNS